MMRTIVAILALSPAMLLAQASASAQPGSTPVLVSSLSPAVTAAGDRVASDPKRISTYTPPKRIHSAEPNLNSAYFRRPFLGDRTVVLDLTVDATGKPEQIAVEKSAGQWTDAAVIAAVSQYRYEPATLNGRAVATPVKLNYVIEQ